jgi:hypothetical protein
MSDITLPGSIEPAKRRGPDLDRGIHPASGIIFLGIIASALLFVAYSIYRDVELSGTPVTTYAPSSCYSSPCSLRSPSSSSTAFTIPRMPSPP